ncbi:AbrB/MazE/SpoVT family DNA-binding domain-containing protein [Candidatus Shapirobacteria bacterium]|nr:AbrB/MazE/SpoVT family DNA-binding domain-containing protein [Candidatus Shapirobacteria bacterium]
MDKKVIRTGNSLAVTVPAQFAAGLGVRAGDFVKVRAREDKGEIVYSFSGAKQLSLPEEFLPKGAKQRKKDSA